MTGSSSMDGKMPAIADIDDHIGKHVATGLNWQQLSQNTLHSI